MSTRTRLLTTAVVALAGATLGYVLLLRGQPGSEDLLSSRHATEVGTVPLSPAIPGEPTDKGEGRGVEPPTAEASSPVPVVVTPQRVVADRIPPIRTREDDLATLDEQGLWRLARSGDPTVSIARRVAAAEVLLERSLSNEDRAEALSMLAFNLRGLQAPTQQRQVDALRELIQVSGAESELGQRAATQMGWPLWELGRTEEAYRAVMDVVSAPRATDRYRGLALWAAMVFAIGLDRMPEAEEHFTRLTAIRHPDLSSTVTLARQRIAAARRAHAGGR